MGSRLVVRMLVGSVLVGLGLAGFAAVWRPQAHSGALVHAQNAGACDLSTIAGSYGLLAHGTVFLDASGHPVAGGANHADVSLIEVVTFDGQGGLSITHTTSTVNGAITQEMGAGTYTMNPDCTGTTTVGGNPPAISLLVVVDGGRQIDVMETDSGFDLTGTATRQ